MPPEDSVPPTRGVPPSAPTLSIVAPALDEEGNVEPFHAALERALAPLGLPWELVLVDDGSRDATWERMRALCERDPRVKAVRLSRNFGHQYALLAGLARCRGAAVVSMDIDLQHPPRVIPRLVEEWHRGSKIVNTVRRDSEAQGPFKRITSRLFYRVFSFLSGTQIEPGMADFRLLDRAVVNALLSFREQGLFLRGLVPWLGFSSARVEFDCEPRFSGSTSYTLRRMLRFAWTGVTSFSVVPLRIAVVIGLLTSAFAFEQLLEAIYRKVVLGVTVPGWTQIMVVMGFLFGVLFVLLGIIGEYIGRILIEVRARPRYFVSEEVGSLPAQPGREAAG